MFDRIQVSDRNHVYDNTVYSWLFWEVNTFKPKPYANSVWGAHCNMTTSRVLFRSFSEIFSEPDMTGPIFHS